ncbi:hypothetical protein niasHS_009162 [Heterodera schachtii]|uniref:Uncharacterized protein n=1 Tax=Heterodera schachtii TaxID=97005 RepID=A0ABD2JE70_HETSC
MFLVVACLTCWTHYSYENSMDDVGNLLKEFSAMTDTAADVLAKLDAIGKGTYSLMKFAGPIGKMLHTTLTMALQVDSDQLQALKELQSQIASEFEAVGKKIDFLIVQREYTESMREYGRLIDWNINHLEHLLDMAIDTRHPFFSNKYETACGSNTESPLKLLVWLNNAVNKNCGLPSTKENKIYERAQQLMEEVENKRSINSGNDFTMTREYKKWKTDVLVRLTAVKPFQAAEKRIVSIKNALSKVGFSNFTSVGALKKIFSKLFFTGDHETVKKRGKRSESEYECFLKTIAFRYERRREPLLDHANIIISDVARIGILAIACASIEAKGDVHVYQNLTKSSDKLTKDIANGMRKWIRAEQEFAWPHVILAQAENSLGKNEIMEKEYGRVARKIQHVANQLGKQNYIHQVVVSPAWNEPEYFMAGCLMDNCTTIYQKKGVNVVITRFSWNDHDYLGFRLPHLHEAIKRNRDQILAEMSKQFKLNGGTADLRSIMALNVRSTFTETVYRKDMWQNFVLVHNRKFFNLACTIPLGIAGVELQGLPAYDNQTEFSNSQFFTVANRYKLILML